MGSFRSPSYCAEGRSQESLLHDKQRQGLALVQQPARQHTSPHLHHAPTASAPAEMHPTNLWLPSSTRRPSGCPPAPSALPKPRRTCIMPTKRVCGQRLRSNLSNSAYSRACGGACYASLHENQAFIHSVSQSDALRCPPAPFSSRAATCMARPRTGTGELPRRGSTAAAQPATHLAQLNHAVGAEVEDDHGIACKCMRAAACEPLPLLLKGSPAAGRQGAATDACLHCSMHCCMPSRRIQQPTSSCLLKQLSAHRPARCPRGCCPRPQSQMSPATGRRRASRCPPSAAATGRGGETRAQQQRQQHQRHEDRTGGGGGKGATCRIVELHAHLQ